MRARPSQIMAQLRKEGDLGVKDAWSAYRLLRDRLSQEGERMSFAALKRHPRLTSGAVKLAAGEMLEPDENDFWELTVNYAGEYE